jgi:hypothetical protein
MVFDFPYFVAFLQNNREQILFAFSAIGAACLPKRRHSVIEAATGLVIYLVSMQEFRGPVRLGGIFDDLELPMTFVWWIVAGVAFGSGVKFLVGRTSARSIIYDVKTIDSLIFLTIVSVSMFFYQWMPYNAEFPYSEFPFTRWWITTVYLLVAGGFWIFEVKGNNETVRIQSS